MVHVIRNGEGGRSIAGGGKLQLFYRLVDADPEFTVRIGKSAPVGQSAPGAGFYTDADILQGSTGKGVHHGAHDNNGLSGPDFAQ